VSCSFPYKTITLPTKEYGLKYLLLISAVCAALLFFSPGWAATPGKTAASGSLAFALPPDRAIVKSGLLTVVLKCAPGLVDEIHISVNDRKQSMVSKKFKADVICYDGLRL
jgi:hypothetical protein